MKRFRRIGGAVTGAAFTLVIAGPAAHAGEYYSVVIEKFAFVPAILTIRPGDTVEFVNKDIVPHTATGDDRRWDTGELGKGRSASIEFTGAGTFAYHCTFHPHMKAEILVTTN
jgi:plastocyanin